MLNWNLASILGILKEWNMKMFLPYKYAWILYVTIAASPQWHWRRNFFLEIVTSASGIIVTIYHFLDIPEQSSRLSWSRVIRWAVHSLSLTCCCCWPIKNTDDWVKQLSRLACLIHVWMLTSSFKWDLNRILFKDKHLWHWETVICSQLLFFVLCHAKKQKTSNCALIFLVCC